MSVANRTLTRNGGSHGIGKRDLGHGTAGNGSAVHVGLGAVGGLVVLKNLVGSFPVRNC